MTARRPPLNEKDRSDLIVLLQTTAEGIRSAANSVVLDRDETAIDEIGACRKRLAYVGMKLRRGRRDRR